MPKFDERITVSLDKETLEYLEKLSAKKKCSVSQAFRTVVLDHKRRAERYVYPIDEPADYAGEGVA